MWLARLIDDYICSIIMTKTRTRDRCIDVVQVKKVFTFLTSFATWLWLQTLPADLVVSLIS